MKCSYRQISKVRTSKRKSLHNIAHSPAPRLFTPNRSCKNKDTINDKDIHIVVIWGVIVILICTSQNRAESIKLSATKLTLVNVQQLESKETNLN